MDPRFYNDIGYHKGNFPLSMQRVLTRHFVLDFVTRGPIKHAKIDNMCNSAANIFCDYSLSIDHINYINRFGLTNFID